MQDLLDILNKRANHTSFPLEKPDEDQILDAQEAILIPFPKAYHQFLLSCSHLIIGGTELSTVADPQTHTYLPEVAALAWDQGLPRHLLPIAQKADELYCLTPDGDIELWRNQQVQEETWEDIWDWAEQAWL